MTISNRSLSPSCKAIPRPRNNRLFYTKGSKKMLVKKMLVFAVITGLGSLIIGCHASLLQDTPNLHTKSLQFEDNGVTLSININQNMVLEVMIINRSAYNYCVDNLQFPFSNFSVLEYFPLTSESGDDALYFKGPQPTYIKREKRSAEMLYQDFQKVTKNSQLKRKQNLLDLYELDKSGKVLSLQFNVTLYKCDDLKNLYEAGVQGYPHGVSLKHNFIQFKY